LAKRVEGKCSEACVFFIIDSLVSGVVKILVTLQASRGPKKSQVEKTISDVLVEGKVKTYDLG